jgi:predicted transcriptional regulator
MSAKEELIAKIKELPDDVSTDRVREELDLAMREKEVLSALEEGHADIAAGRVKTIEQVQAQFDSWVAQWKK